ncbi:MAG: transport system ATP-binding/permease protein [Chthoniobacter sp.]|jgi:ABC-type multidrug transport system ATPase subunit/pSer/pThr/pTyr-binding forkhead associated (FHA) protein|nr:transport system ATP-binding/permease protein [Chthoniobacter sp.]
MPAHLALISGLPPKVFPLEEGTAIAGRSTTVDVELSHVEISRQHCRFAWDGSTCTVEDLGSVRGTRVNGERIKALTVLRPGDRVGVGPAILEFGLGEAPEIEPDAVVEPAEEAAEMLVLGKKTDRIEVDRQLLIGREPGTDVWLNHPGVSRRHAKVAPVENSGCMVTDLHSTAGSFVNGHRFDTHELTVGDRLQIGPFCFQFDGHALNRVANTSGGTIRSTGIFVRRPGLTILDNVTIQIPASRFVGIIGPSGAGKSTLLRVISGMDAPEDGVVLVDGEDMYASDATRSFGFVPQEDIVHPELTVADALRFSGRLRLAADTPPLGLVKLVLQTMDQLGLREHAGKTITQLSGGQRKRVSVGAELLAKPSILFLDEPSSGLDPATEFKLMEVLRDLADTGCTIVCTTHVMENAFLMDQLIVMVGGCLAFQGSAAEVRSYFGVNKLTALYDQLLERPAKHWQDAFHQRTEAGGLPEETSPLKRAAARARRAFALPILLARQWAILRSDWRNFVILVGQPLVIAALVCWVTDERARVMFFAYIATLWFGCSNAAQRIVEELAIYKRERLVGVGAHAYLASKFIFLTAVTALQALLLYAAALLFEGGRDGAVSWQIAALLGTTVAGVGMGCAISALARSVMQAVMIVPLLLIPLIIFSGYTVPPTEMSKAVLFVSRLTPTFSAQVVMDTSFLWKRTMEGELMRDHGQSLRNLDPEREIETGATFSRSRAAWLALVGHGLYLVCTYLISWVALKAQERK